MENAKQQIISALTEKGITNYVIWDFVGDVVIDLSWEDWKIHSAVTNCLSDLFGYDGWDVAVTESDGSDCYSARYVVSNVA